MPDTNERLAALDSRIAKAETALARQCWTALQFAIAGDVEAAARAEAVMKAMGDTLQLMRRQRATILRKKRHC